ncbi:MAG: hypothetical protein IKU63_08875 [Bacteroidaceae bacterium]|nr:hypothetical protein [Bacteroidaceae bacterium]
MRKNCFKRLATVLALLVCLGTSIKMAAQAVIFPQEKQAGTAVVKEVVDGYTIGNDLFIAKFVKADGKITFGGCEELGLIAGSEIFKVQLGDGTEIPASAFTLDGDVEVESLAGNSAAVKASRRYNGQQIKATFTHSSGLKIEWRAVLRDGSHYLRTEMDILNSGSEGINMNSIYPMMYTVQNVDGEKAPVVVGNTRGAVIASDKIFAGVETPTAYNMAGEATDLESFVFKAWDGASSWAWTPEENDIPADIKGLSQYAADAVNASRGYVIFREAGDCTITLDYTDGSNRLQILGVDILDVKGTVIDSDYHFGFTGGSDNNRDYTVTIPKVGAYMVRIFVTNAGNGEGYGSKGTIAYSKKVTLPSLVYDLASTETPSVSPEIKEPEKLIEIIPEEGALTASQGKQTQWTSGLSQFQNWTGAIPEGMSTPTASAIYLDKHYTIEAGNLNVVFDWTDGNHGLNILGVQLISTEGVISKDYHVGFTGGSDRNNTYSLVVPQAGNYIVRMFVDKKSDGVDGRGNIDFTLTEFSNKISAEEGQKDTWVQAWTGFADWTGTLPEGTTATGTAKYRDQGYYIGVGTLSVLFDYTSGDHGLYVLGVQVLDYKGNVVSEEFKNGFTGSNSTVPYTVTVPKAGYYTVRYITDYRNGGTVTNGDITLSLAAINSITTEAGQQDTWTSAWTGFENWTGTLPEGTTATGTAKYIDKKYHIADGKLSVLFDYTGGSHGFYVLGVQVLDGKGKVVAQEFKNGFTGTNSTVTYSMKIPAEDIYTVRYIADYRNGGTDTNGDITLSLEEIVVKTLGTIGEDETLADAWTPSDWKTMPAEEVPNRVNEVGCSDANARVIEQQITITSAGTLSVEFLYATGSARLNMVGVDLVDATGSVAVDDYHAGYTGTEKSGNVYKFNVFAPGTYTIRYFADNSETINSTGNINLKLTVDYTLHLVAPATTPLVGKWSRITTLAAGEEWNISAVVGVIAPGQARRSFLCYSERERAVPWRAVPAYISWYELNINRNNAAPGHEHENFTEEQCLPILREWKTQLYDKYGEAPYAFVWDDGWDTYGEWQFHSGFPNGFTNMDNIGREMGAGQGAWLGPVGGYGTSGGYRRNYWNSTKTGGMQLSNPLYYEVFVNAVTGLLRDKGYDFRFFKFDGISAQFSSVGPDAGATGNENAEAIIMAEKVLRGIKEDVFLNTTVGTWASPFWFQHTDAIWRQEKDDGTIGNNSNNRENWITYRDRLVYQNYVQNSPLCPINTLMTHGFILTEFGGPAGFSRDWKSVINELRCAFACGSGMVELYNDYKLTNSLVNPETGNAGELWGEIAKCMQWQRKNADVLPDIHWVGGNPWTGAKAEVYGWAAWNAQKAVLTLRNGANNAQEYTFTLREALDIPAYVNTTITFTKAFADQLALEGLTEGQAINIDTELTVTLPGSSVYVFDGSDNTPKVTIPAIISEHKVGTFYANEAVEIPAGVTAYVALSNPVMEQEGTEEYATGVITMTPIMDGIVPAKTGVLICGEQGTYYFTSTTDAGTPIEGNLMKGYAGAAQYETVTLPEDASTYILSVKNGTAGFYKKDAAFKVYNHKSYLQVPKNTMNALRIRFGEESDPTAIPDIILGDTKQQAVYDLQGRRVQTPGKGIYIVGGKKVVY